MSLRDYLSVLRRRVWLILIFAILVPATAVAYSATQQHMYSATSQVLFNRQSVANQLSNTSDIGQQQQSFQQVLITQSKLARTPTVLADTLERANRISRPEQIRRLREASSAKPSPDADLLVFTVTSSSAEEAKALASAYANAYVAYRRSLDGAALSGALADVNKAIDKAAAEGPDSKNLVTSLTRNQQELETRLALVTQNAQVVSLPQDANQVQPRPVRNAILGLVVGLVLGLAMALLRDVLDTRVRSSVELEETLGLPILAQVSRPRGLGSALVMQATPGAREAESFRILRTNLSFGRLAHKAHVLMVTSAVQGEGKSTTIANLAIAEAISGKRVALVDLDLRRPTVSTLFDADTTRGVTSVALGAVSLSEALTSIPLPTTTGASADHGDAELCVLASGPLPPDPAEFIGTNVVRSLLEDLRGRFDLVLVDAPPLIGVSDASVLTAYVDAVFLCARLGVVRRPNLRELSRSLAPLERPILGIVVTGAQADGVTDYYGYGSYTSQRQQPAATATAAKR